MGKYQSSSRKKVKERNHEVHVAWRGIGCLMMLVIPIMAIALGYETINYGLENDWVIPFQLLGFPRYPEWFYLSNGLMQLLSPFTATKHFYAYATASILYMILLSGVMSVIYAYVYRVVAPPRYGPLDVERPNIKTKKYKR
jgi:hypothetical protein